MNNLAAFVLGLLVGWLAEWIVDWLYWRRRLRATLMENAQLSQANQQLAAANLALQKQIASLQEEVDWLKLGPTLTQLMDKKGNDNLQAIKGVGPVFARRLKEAGVTTFAQLAQCTPQEMEKILGTLFKRFFAKENAILAQAKEFAEIRAKLGQRKA